LRAPLPGELAPPRSKDRAIAAKTARTGLRGKQKGFRISGAMHAKNGGLVGTVRPEWRKTK